jgi:hypothetical protein
MICKQEIKVKAARNILFPIRLIIEEERINQMRKTQIAVMRTALAI